MRKKYYAALTWLMMAVACSSEDETVIPVETSYTDPYENLAAFREKLAASEYGWSGALRLQEGGMYTVYIELESNGDVHMVADITEETASAVSTSKYTIEITEQINASLLFKEGSYLDALSENGKVRFDKSFAYKGNNSTGDSLVLVGNAYGDELLLTKVTAADQLRFTNGSLKPVLSALPAYLETGNFFYADLASGKRVQFEMNTEIRQILFTSVDGQAQVIGFDYAYTFDGIRLNHPLALFGETLDVLLWDPNTEGLYGAYQGTRFDFQPSDLPAIPLHYLLGSEYPYDLSLQSPSLDEVAGWSATFKAAWLADETALFDDHDIELYYIDFDFGPTGTLNLNVYFGEAGRIQLVRLPYAFEKTAAGLYTFTPEPIDDSTAEGEKAVFIQQELPTVLGLFERDAFSIEFHTRDPAYGLLARFTSQQHPDVYCTAFFY